MIVASVLCFGPGLARAQETTRFSYVSEAGGVRARLHGTWQTGQSYVIEDTTDLLTWTRVSPVMKPVSGTLDWSHKQSIGGGAFYAGTSLVHRNVRRYYRLRKVAPADPAPAAPATVPVGRLTQPGGPTTPLTYITSAGWTLKMDLSTITITSPDGKTSYQHWGHPHENLNGKHLKDWLGTSRTMLLPGDTMIDPE